MVIVSSTQTFRLANVSRLFRLAWRVGNVVEPLEPFGLSISNANNAIRMRTGKERSLQREMIV